MALILIVFLFPLSCDNGTKPKIVSASITVPAITAVSNPMQFGAVSALSGWNEHFQSGDVTYRLSIDGGELLPDGTTTVAGAGLSNGTHTITQTFFYKNNPISGGSRTGTIGVLSNAIASITQTFPALTLNLSKEL